MKMNGNLTVLWCNEQYVNGTHWLCLTNIERYCINFTFSRLAFVTIMRCSLFRSGWYFSRGPFIKDVEPSALLTKVSHALQTALGLTSWLFSSGLKYCQRSAFLGIDFLLPGVPFVPFFLIGFLIFSSFGSRWINQIWEWKNNYYTIVSDYVKERLKLVSMVQQKNSMGN